MTGQSHCTSRFSRSVCVLNTCTVFSDFKALGNNDAKEELGSQSKMDWGIPTGGVEFTILLSIKISHLMNSQASFSDSPANG